MVSCGNAIGGFINEHLSIIQLNLINWSDFFYCKRSKRCATLIVVAIDNLTLAEKLSKKITNKNTQLFIYLRESYDINTLSIPI